MTNFVPMTDHERACQADAVMFGADAWVHCDSHGRPHTTGWCSVCVSKKTLLASTSYAAAVIECREKGLWLYQDLENSNEK